MNVPLLSSLAVLAWLTPLAAGAAASALVFLLLKSAARAQRLLPGRLVNAPPGYRWLRLPAELLASPLRPILPLRVRTHLALQLRRAEVDAALDPALWLGMRVAYGLLLAVVCACVLRVIHGDASVAAPLAGVAVAAGFALGGSWIADRVKRNEQLILRELPAYMDMLTLAVEGGCTLTVAIRMAVDKAAPSPLRRAFETVLREVRAGRTRAEALEHVCERLATPGLSEVTRALAQAEATGMSLGSILRAQAEQRTNERFARAEKLAMEAPVKMLGPLILCIFPCTFLVIGFPIVVRLTMDLTP